MSNFWVGKQIAVLGAAFIGSHLVERLLECGAKIRVVNLTDKWFGYFNGGVEKYARDLRYLSQAQKSVRGADIVFHLAADHGGRGYVDLRQGATAGNFLLDGSVFRACLLEKVGKVVFASSGCVYPNRLQTNPNEELYLEEYMVKAPHDADNSYGWAKLMGEETLRAYYKDFGLKSAILRYFTVYGERALENHAVMAMIAKAFIKQNPFEVWGNGNQIRNWTHVDDIVEGTLLAAEMVGDSTAINLGTMERIKVIDAAGEVLRYMNLDVPIKLLPYKPTGPRNRVADNSLAKELLGWTPRVKFFDGLHRTIDWYLENKDYDIVKQNLERWLIDK